MKKSTPIMETKSGCHIEIWPPYGTDLFGECGCILCGEKATSKKRCARIVNNAFAICRPCLQRLINLLAMEEK